MGHQWIFNKDIRYSDQTPDTVKSAIDFQRYFGDPRIIMTDFMGDFPVLPMLTRVRFVFPIHSILSGSIQKYLHSIGSFREGVVIARNILEVESNFYVLVYDILDPVSGEVYGDVSFQYVSPVYDIRGGMTFSDLVQDLKGGKYLSRFENINDADGFSDTPDYSVDDTDDLNDDDDDLDDNIHIYFC